MNSPFQPDLLRDKVCLVTGGGTGLGRATSQTLAALGAHVVICGRRLGPIDDTAAAICARGGSAWAGSLDIRDESGAENFVEGVLERHGRVDVLINNAGGQFHSPAERITTKGYRAVLELNAVGTFNMTRAVANLGMIPEGHGRILNVTLSPHNGFPLMVHTAAARAAVESMTRTLSIEWARHGITVCALAPGIMNTDSLYTKYQEEMRPFIDTAQPLGRPGAESEWANFVAYMASDAANFFTGCVLTMDGGRDNFPSVYPPPGMLDVVGELPSEERAPKKASKL